MNAHVHDARRPFQTGVYRNMLQKYVTYLLPSLRRLPTMDSPVQSSSSTSLCRVWCEHACDVRCVQSSLSPEFTESQLIHRSSAHAPPNTQERPACTLEPTRGQDATRTWRAPHALPHFSSASRSGSPAGEEALHELRLLAVLVEAARLERRLQLGHLHRTDRLGRKRGGVGRRGRGRGSSGGEDSAAGEGVAADVPPTDNAADAAAAAAEAAHLAFFLGWDRDFLRGGGRLRGGRLRRGSCAGGGCTGGLRGEAARLSQRRPREAPQRAQERQLTPPLPSPLPSPPSSPWRLQEQEAWRLGMVREQPPPPPPPLGWPLPPPAHRRRRTLCCGWHGCLLRSRLGHDGRNGFLRRPPPPLPPPPAAAVVGAISSGVSASSTKPSLFCGTQASPRKSSRKCTHPSIISVEKGPCTWPVGSP